MSYRMMSRCLMLLLVFHWAPKTAEAQEHRTVGTGSSVLLTALPTNDRTVIKHIQWEYISSGPALSVVDYYGTGTEPIIFKSYKDRVIFYSSNGSLLLKNVQETDSGTYRATVNLNKIKARQTTLLVLEPMSKAQIQINSTVVGSSIELSCNVLVGKVQAIDWKKDGKPLPRNRCYEVSENFSLLYIPEAQKSDCGSFSCNASNDISWQETSVNLTIEAGELWRWPVVFIHGLVCVSAILMFTAAVLWMWEEGFFTALVLYMIVLMWVIMVTLLISAVLAICPQHLGMFKKKTMHRVILDTAAPGGVILVVLFAIFLTQNIHHLQRKGCSPFFDSTAAILIAAAISLLILLAPFVWYHRKKKKQEKDQQERDPAEVRVKCPRKPFHWTLKIFSLVLHSTTKTERSVNSARTFLSFQYFKTLTTACVNI
ncbi:natural killer cell receptor 2B4-like isoform X2 [Mauremys reevesii]|uniref:natural killer cell receptor 2B4-like isoform X2 n=1 Tax=Mauremys reevesii TaxID=260615 RepID=UPI00193F4A28|nr:natural killer cell receptor 2B4-like isoform X2 [Mauremys reevesii]